MKRLYVVGIGPGAISKMSIEAKDALDNSEVIVGYQAYIDLISNEYSDKEFYSTPMKKEIDRCMEALRLASTGKTVSIICSGDAGVYGMASPVLELASEYPDVDICIVPGISAALSGAAVLGAPLAHDFCVISLSDLLTPWEVIEKRLHGAGMGDFCIAIYNPSSMKRADYLKKACEILLEYKSPDTVCGLVRNIGREGENYEILTLEELKGAVVDMFTTVFVGNAATRKSGDYMITPRGYRIER